MYDDSSYMIDDSPASYERYEGKAHYGDTLNVCAAEETPSRANEPLQWAEESGHVSMVRTVKRRKFTNVQKR